MAKIIVYNPNSSSEMTAQIDASLDDIRSRASAEILCVRNERGPAGIETDHQVASVAKDVETAVRTSDADVFIVACFSDPGVLQSREFARMPVLGIAESAYRAATRQTGRFGIISMAPPSIERHAAHLQSLGMRQNCVGDRSLDLSIASSGDAGTIHRLIQVGAILRDRDKAPALILGCAGLGVHRGPLQRKLGVIVFDPVEAAVSEAIALIEVR
jgi:allantoin racemase